MNENNKALTLVHNLFSSVMLYATILDRIAIFIHM